MLPQTESERMKTQERLRNFYTEVQRCKSSNMESRNQGANNIVNLWLPDAMIQQIT